MLGEIEKIRGPLVILLDRLEATGKQHQTAIWRQLEYCLLDALERLDVAQGIAETAQLHALDVKDASAFAERELRFAEGLERLRPLAYRIEEEDD